MLLLRRLCADESGSTAIEYALFAAMISVIMMVGLSAFGTAVSAKYQEISTAVESATSGS
jgi:pilus assembly protein Flp/PilA